MEVPLVDHSRDLFEGALSHCRHLENAPARGTSAGDQRRIAHLLVEMSQDGGPVDQHFAIIQDKGRDAGQGADPGPASSRDAAWSFTPTPRDSHDNAPHLEGTHS